MRLHAVEADSDRNTIVSVEDYVRLGTSKNKQSPVDGSDRICTRFSVHLIPWQREKKNRSLDGGAVVVGQSEAAAAVAHQLQQQGLHVVRAADAALDAVSGLLKDETLDVSHLFMLDAFDDEQLSDGSRQWCGSRDALVARYELIQQWFARLEKSKNAFSGYACRRDPVGYSRRARRRRRPSVGRWLGRSGERSTHRVTGPA